jgi:outer membrane protein
MKLNSVKINQFATVFAFSAILFSCGTPDKTEKKDTATTPASTLTENSQEKIVYVNSDSLLNKYQYFKDLQAKMSAKGKVAEADMRAKGQAFQRDMQQYQSQASTMTGEERAKTEERLARKQQELQAYQQNAGAAFQNEQAKENEKLYDKVADYLKGYAKEKGYKMVLKYQKGVGDILFADDKLDVTSEVIKGLNEAYKAEKK